MNEDYAHEAAEDVFNELSLIFESEELRWEMNHADMYDYTKTSYFDSYVDSMND